MSSNRGARRLRILVAMLAGIAALIVAGCGGSSSGGDGSTSAGSKAPTGGTDAPTITAAAKTCPRTGGTLVVGLEEEPTTLFTLSAETTAGTAALAHMIFSNLVDLDNRGDPVPSLADSWTVSPDGKTYTFKLNPDATWHDGQPVTSADVAFTMSQLSSQNPTVFAVIGSVATPDPHTAVFKLKKPFPGLLVALANPDDNTMIVPKHLVEGKNLDKAPINQAPVGSGPFRFVKWNKGSDIELERNDRYFKPGLPCLDKVLARFTPDPASRKAALESGEVNFLYSYQVPLEDLDRYSGDPSYQVIHGGLGVGTSDFIVFNLRNQYLRDTRVRQAIAYALDRDRLADIAFYGQAPVAHSVINSSVTKFYTGRYDVYDYNTQKAESLLDAAGFRAGSDGKRFTVKLRIRTDRAFEVRIASVVKSQLAKVGIDVEIQPGDAVSTYTSIYTDFDFDMAVQLRTTGPDPATKLSLLFTRAGVGTLAANGGHYYNPELEKLIPEAGTETDEQKSVADWDRVQQITMRDLPWLPLAEFPNVQLATAGFGDLIVEPLGYLGTFEHAYQK
jgi:peptide/nickel transport system substrate-binding protein